MKVFDRVVGLSLQGNLPVMLFIVALLAGALALVYTPREEEPQIVVPVIDVGVTAPGLSVKQIERQVTIPLEKLLSQIPGVEHVYSSSAQGKATVTLRFYVGQDREDSLLNTYNKLYSNQQIIPAVVSDWSVNPVEVDDVPILMLALWSSEASRYGDYELRRLAEEVATFLQTIENSSDVRVVGGRPRKLQVNLQPEALAAHQTTMLDIVYALQNSNLLSQAGSWTLQNRTMLLESGDALRRLDDLQNLVINVVDGHPVHLKDVSHIVDGPSDPDHYTWIRFSRSEMPSDQPMVVISMAKQRGSNAVSVARDAHSLISELKTTLLPPEIEVEFLRDYGATADEKVNNLTQSLAFAILTVVVFLGVFLGWRQAFVVALALPVCYGITLALDLAFGYTINRVTLFALILALGLLVDDPITGVDNISRHLEKARANPDRSVLAAMSEIRIPLVMSTLTIVLAFLPLAFITGMMGPYMAPMAFNVPVSVIASTIVAFLVTPWLTKRLVTSPQHGATNTTHSHGQQAYQRWLSPLIEDRRKAKLSLYVVLFAFILACSLPLFRLVPLKLLPFDNKNEVQILVDAPEGTSLEQTAAITRLIANEVGRVPEVKVAASFVGVPSPIDFNGMVRQYYQRHASYQADIRLTLVDKGDRHHQSHHVVLRLRELLQAELADQLTGIQVKVVEVPPGPPVLSTVVAEVYGDATTEYERQITAARQLAARLRQEPHVVEVDTSIQQPQIIQRFVVDKEKAALSGISTVDVNETLKIANAGLTASYMQVEREANPLPIELRLALEDRLQHSDFLRIQLKGRANSNLTTSELGLDQSPQPLVALGEIGGFHERNADQVIFRKNLKPVVYVLADLSGRTPAEVIADIHADRAQTSQETSHWQTRNFLASGGGIPWSLPPGTDFTWRGEGEWQITLDVFRDMGIAFLFALIAIFAVLRMQTGSASLSLIIMSAIPLTLIGIMPGFWFLNQFGERTVAGAPEPVLFTATAMIGMIALAGIVVRNSLILVEFITQARQAGSSIRDAVLEAGSIRMRPVLLTAGTTLLGNLIITLDPVFSGLAIAIIFGIIASTLFTLIVVPVVYYLVYNDSQTEASHA